MTELLTAAQMRAIEQAAIESGDVTGLELMERAGRGVVEAILEEWPSMALTSQRAVVLCGPGNNGGDGFVVARLLKQRGWEVEVFLYGDEEKLPVDAKVNCLLWRELGEVQATDEIVDKVYLLERKPSLFIDALFGTGLTRPIPADVNSFMEFSEHWQFEDWFKGAVSIDIPSGVCSDSGFWLGSAVIASLTVSFHRAKIGHYLSSYSDSSYSDKKIGGAVLSGKLNVVDIGLTKGAPNATKRTKITTNRSTRYGLSKPRGHKYSNGHALILSGPSGKTGAARLAARAALRIGAGVVTVACPPDALAENAAQLNAIMLTRVADSTALAAVLQGARINALCLGPALGLGEEQAALVRETLTVRGDRTPYGSRKIVLDADALTLLSRDGELFGMLHENCVLTPHAGEFARLFPDIAAKLAEPAIKGPAYSKVDATRDAAKRAGCVVLYKGADTVIADASGRAAINSAHYERSAPWLATAGSGDVLAGFITGLLARGFTPMQAAETGAWLHVECALKFGAGLIAEDIAEQLPKVFSDLGL